MAPLQIVAVVFLLWHFIRYVAFVAIGYTILLVLIQPMLSRVFIAMKYDQHVKFEIC